MQQLIHQAFNSPIIYVTIAVVVLLVIFTLSWRKKVLNNFQKPSALTLPLMRAYWVDIFYNRVIVRGLFAFWRLFRKVQTGDLNYNNLGIVIGFVLFLLILIWKR